MSPSPDFDLNAVLTNCRADNIEASIDSRVHGFLTDEDGNCDRFVTTVFEGGERSIKWLMPRLKKVLIHTARESGYVLAESDKPDLRLDGVVLFFSLTFLRDDCEVVIQATATDVGIAACSNGHYNVKITLRAANA